MWLTAEQRFVQHLCLRNPFLPFLFREFQASTPYQKQVRESGRTLQHVLHWGCHAHPFFASWEKRLVQCREAEGLVTELWSPRFVTIQWLFSQFCYVKNLSHAEKQRVVSKQYSNGVKIWRTGSWLWIVFSVATQDCSKPMNNCRDVAFSNSRLEVLLPAFQLPMFRKCDAPPEGDLFDMFV